MAQAAAQFKVSSREPLLPGQQPEKRKLAPTPLSLWSSPAATAAQQHRQAHPFSAAFGSSAALSPRLAGSPRTQYLPPVQTASPDPLLRSPMPSRPFRKSLSPVAGSRDVIPMQHASMLKSKRPSGSSLSGIPAFGGTTMASPRTFAPATGTFTVPAVAPARMSSNVSGMTASASALGEGLPEDQQGQTSLLDRPLVGYGNANKSPAAVFAQVNSAVEAALQLRTGVPAIQTQKRTSGIATSQAPLQKVSTPTTVRASSKGNVPATVDASSQGNVLTTVDDSSQGNALATVDASSQWVEDLPIPTPPRPQTDFAVPVEPTSPRPETEAHAGNGLAPPVAAVPASEAADNDVSMGPRDSVIVAARDVVQFCAPNFYVLEDEAGAVVSVMRIGTLTEAASVDWETHDVTAKEGHKYEKSAGTLHFPPGEDHAQIEIPVHSDDIWEISTQFKVHLSNNVNCELGRYLFQCHVTIIDDDTFPSNRWEVEELQSDEAIEEIPGYLLMYDFLKHCVTVVPGVGRRTLFVLIGDQINTLYYLLRTYLLSIYMVDVLFAKDPKGELWGGTQERTAVLVAILLGVPIVVIHCWDYYKAKLDIAGDLRTYFQACLLSKYFNFDEKERARINTAEVQGAIRTETREIVEGAFMKCFSIFKLLGKLIIVSAFVLRENPSALVVVILFPVCTLVWLWLRIGVLVKLAEIVVNTENWVCDSIQTACQCFRLISDYGTRPQVERDFDKKIMTLNESMLQKELCSLNNLKFTSWLSTGLTVGYIIMFNSRVIQGTLSLGTFLAMVKVFSELGEEFKEAFQEAMELTGAIGPLQKITRFMNGRVDLHDSLLEGRYNLEQTLSRRKELRKVDSGNEMMKNTKEDIDAIPIVIEAGMHFKYVSNEEDGSDKESEEEGNEKSEEDGSCPRRHSKGVKATVDLEHLDWSLRIDHAEHDGLQLQQGTMVCISGPHGSGKASALNLLSGLVYPSKGKIYIPSHLRLLHVSAQTMLLEKGLFNNIVFGAVEHGPKVNLFRRNSYISEDDPRRERGMSILGRFKRFRKLQTQLLAEFDNEDLREGDGQAWRASLSYADQAVVHIVRALVMNPEVMVLHRPIVHFDWQTQNTLMEVLREHVSERGLDMGSHNKELRRPRTVIYSTDFPWAAQLADIQLVLDTNIHHEGEEVKWSSLGKVSCL